MFPHIRILFQKFVLVFEMFKKNKVPAIYVSQAFVRT